MIAIQPARQRVLIGAAVATALVALGIGPGPALAQETLKIGVLATLEGPFAAGGQDGMRGAELALKHKNGMAGGKKIEFIKASSNAQPDVAVNATRKLVEQDKVQIMIGPLSGSEGIAVKNYSKSQPAIPSEPGERRCRIRRRTSSASTPKARSGWSVWATMPTATRSTGRWR